MASPNPPKVNKAADSSAGRVYNIGDGQTMTVDKTSRDGSKRVVIVGDDDDSDAASFTSSSTATMPGIDPRIQYFGSNPQNVYQVQGYPGMTGMDPRIQFVGSNPPNIYQTQGTPNTAHYRREYRHPPQGPARDFFKEWKKPVRAPVSVQVAGSGDTFNAVGSGNIVFHDD